MFEELGARRRRLQKRLGARTGGLIEFALISGVFLSVAAILLGKPLGFLPVIVFPLGYALLDWRRQKALAGGADADVLRKRSDVQILIFSTVVSLLGFWIFGGAMAAKEVEGWTPPPERIIDLEIAK